MWLVKEHKAGSAQQEMNVRILVKDMANNTYATYAGEFENHFKERIKEIPKSNSFSADLMYKVSQRNLKSVEVWKLKANGEFNYKMFTLTKKDQ